MVFPDRSAAFYHGTDAAGNVYAAGGYRGYGVAKWDGTTWSKLGPGKDSLIINDYIRTMVVTDSGDVYVAGDFYKSSGYYVMHWDGTTWTELRSATSALGANRPIKTLCRDKAGNLYAAGDFTNSRGLRYVARYDYVPAPVSVGPASGTAAAALTIAPNPNGGRFRLRYSGGIRQNGEVPVSVNIFNALGQRVYSRSFRAGQPDWTIGIELEPVLPAGGYFVQVASGSAVTTRQFVVQR